MNIFKLKQLGLWTDWQSTVVNGLPNYCADRLFVDQGCTDSKEIEQVLKELKDNYNFIDNDGSQRDAQHGGILFDTKYGKVTRTWTDSNVEYNFLLRHLGQEMLQNATVLDVGAGYGRLAVSMSPFVKRYVTVDSVSISVACCKDYINTWSSASNIEVLSVEDLYLMYKLNKTPVPDIAINIHSWNECTLETIEEWLQTLVELRTKFLFTVSHGQLDASRQIAYYSWTEHKTFRPLLEKYFELIVEESIGITKHPHALWRSKA